MTNTGDYNTGSYNTGDYNTGDRNTGEYNTGDRNTGEYNTGSYNTGYRNTGYRNTGDRNTGDYNTGDYNTGYWNICNKETGYFNTEQPSIIRIFNEPCELKKWQNAIKPNFIYFSLTKWISEDDMTKKEKEENPSYKTTKGYLKSYEYKEAFIESYEDLTEEERIKQTEQLKALPNFDKDVFYEISGIYIDKYDKKKITIDGKDIYISNESFEELKNKLL